MNSKDENDSIQNSNLLCLEYNSTTENDLDLRQTIYSKLFGKFGSNLSIRAPFYCNNGKNIFLGDNVYMNFNCVFEGEGKIELGNFTMLAPYVQINTTSYSDDPKERLEGKKVTKDVKIGNSVWIGGGVIILPGVTIGDNCTIGAGSVVISDIPENSVAVGNPCRVIKKIE